MSSKNLKLLVVDDDELLSELIAHKLSQVGYDVSLAEDGEKALVAIEADPPDAIILDGMMPGIDGFDVLRTIKANPETSSIPIIMLSARTMEKDVVGGLSLGADEYMVKPFMVEELVMRLNRLLKKP